MNQLTIITYPAAILRQPLADMSIDEIKQHYHLAKQMDMIMEKVEGVGLATVQVGQTVRLAVINKNTAQSNEHLWLFNPRLTWQSWRTKEDEEGCLSLPGVFGLVRRPSSLIVKYVDAQGQTRELKAKGMLARVIQHEVDHLDGVLFIDRTTKISKGRELLDQWSAVKDS